MVDGTSNASSLFTRSTTVRQITDQERGHVGRGGSSSSNLPNLHVAVSRKPCGNGSNCYCSCFISAIDNVVQEIFLRVDFKQRGFIVNTCKVIYVHLLFILDAILYFPFVFMKKLHASYKLINFVISRYNCTAGSRLHSISLLRTR